MLWMTTGGFGILVLAGGLFGYAKARSLMSLLAGVVCGALLLYATQLIRRAEPAGTLLAIAVSALLVLIFALRLRKTRSFMPAGMLLVLSLAELALLLFAGRLG